MLLCHREHPNPNFRPRRYEVLRQLIVVGFSVNITLLYWLVMYVVVHTIRDLDDS